MQEREQLGEVEVKTQFMVDGEDDQRNEPLLIYVVDNNENFDEMSQRYPGWGSCYPILGGCCACTSYSSARRILVEEEQQEGKPDVFSSRWWCHGAEIFSELFASRSMMPCYCDCNAHRY